MHCISQPTRLVLEKRKLILKNLARHCRLRMSSLSTVFMLFSEFSLIGLALIAVGTGGIKPCVSSFGGMRSISLNSSITYIMFEEPSDLHILYRARLGCAGSAQFFLHQSETSFVSLHFASFRSDTKTKGAGCTKSAPQRSSFRKLKMTSSQIGNFSKNLVFMDLFNHIYTFIKTSHV
jgi:hypothetical protein